MANLTITVDDEVLKRARIRALGLGTSVNRLLADYLAAFAADHQREAVRSILRLSDELEAASGEGGRTWRRDELYRER